MGATQGDQVCTKPQERLVAIYPKEGTFWHEHPFGILDPAVATWVTPEQVEAARVFTEFVLTPPMQRIVMTEGFMRPANPAVPLEFPLVPENGVDPAQPTTVLDVPDIQVITAIQQSWVFVKKQADIMLVIDVSGSMNDDNKIEEARQAALAFLDGMEPNNRVGLAFFNNEYQVRVPLGLFEQNGQQIRSHIQSMRADGGTELYDAIRQAVSTINTEDDSERIRAVVILSDGQDTGERGVSLNDALNAINASRDSLNPVIVVPVAYGSDADINALNNVARTSATEVQAADPENISRVLELIGSFF
jgi:Ca-activated chloride channel family protein